MKPKIDITITDTNGAYSSLADGIEPYEVYVNNEPVCTPERLDELGSENDKLRELLKDYFNAPCADCNPWREGWQGCKHCDGGSCTLATRAIELGIEVEE